MVTYEVKYWTGSRSNRWETFEVYGAPAVNDAYRVGRMLAALFSAVEVHHTDAHGLLSIERL